MYVSIILPTYNRAHILSECIEQVINQSYPSWELIILDDHSSDKTFEIAQRYSKKDPRIILIRNDQRIFLDRNKKKGIAKSTYPYVFIIEDDLILEKNCLQNLVFSYIELKKKYNVGAVAPRLTSPEPRENIPDNEPFVFNKLTGEIWNNYDLEGKEPIETFTLHACSLIPKEVIFDVGGYSTGEYIGNCYREETDLYFRMRKKGYKLFFDPTAQALHKSEKKGGSKFDKEILTHYYCIRNQWVFLRKFFHYKAIIMFPLFIVQHIYHKFLLHKITSHKSILH